MKTVKRIAAMVMAAGIMTAASAQEQKTSTEGSLTPKFGVKGGVNLTNLYVDEVSDENMKVGANVGLYGKLPITRGISIQPEVLYSMKGAQLTYNNIIQGSGKYRYNLNYIETPVLAVFNVARNFNIHAGPYAAFLVSAKVKNVNAEGNVRGVTELNKDNFHNIDYGAVAGVGFDIENVTLGARYNYGMREIAKEGRASELAPNAKNSAISFYIGFGF